MRTERMPRRFLGTRHPPRSAVGDRLRTALVYEKERPRKCERLRAIHATTYCACVYTGVKERAVIGGTGYPIVG